MAKLYVPPADWAPVLGLTTNADATVMVTIAQVGVVLYHRQDAESVARLLEDAATMIREEAAQCAAYQLPPPPLPSS